MRKDDLEWDEYANYKAHQMVNETGEELLVFVYGAPPERTGADVIDSAV